MKNHRIIHVCQNYNVNLFIKLFENIGNSSKYNQVVFYPYIGKGKFSYSSKYKVIAKKSVPNLFRHFFLFRGFFNAYIIINSVSINKNDIIHCHTLFNDGLVGLILKFIYGCKVVVSIRNSDLLIYQYKFWLRPYLFFFKKYVNSFISLSPTLQENFKFLSSEVIGNGIKSESIIKVPREISGFKKVKLLYIGRIIKRKNLDKVINLYLSNTDKYSLTIIGDAYPKTKWSTSLLKKIELLDLDYYQNLSHSEINNQLDLADIFILPASNETFGIVYLESLCRAMPIIYKKGTGVDGLFSSPVGFGVENESVKELEVGIEYILNNYNQLSSNCLSEVVNHTWSNVPNNILAIYNKLSLDV